MPNAEFLETNTLYNRWRVDHIPSAVSMIPKPPINMFCGVCKSFQTFNMANEYWEGTNQVTNAATIGNVLRIVYRCEHCHKFSRYFLVKFDGDANGEYVAKVGQDPPWDIIMDKNLEKELGEHSNYYKHGLICESQTYGIGAFAYYRRIVEEILEKLLEDIPKLMTGADQERYIDALKQVKAANRADEKIKLVKDLLPSILKPNGTNPLQILYEVLSEGIHGKTDEQCVVLAQNIRVALVYLVNRLSIVKTADAEFTDSMKKLLERKKEQQS